MTEWKEFRPTYFNLSILRTRLPPNVPLLGVSATLDAETLEVVQERCSFKEDTRILKTPLDRPEIYMQVCETENNLKGMLDLQHMLPARISSGLDIPKTIIFMDSIKDVITACGLIRQWMRQLEYSSESAKWVMPFVSTMAVYDKQRIAQHFGARSDNCPWPRIIVATDAYGLGIDNPDVKRVIQWLLPSSIQKVYQRMGRAMRCGQEQAHFIFLVPPWCLGPRSGIVGPQPADRSSEVSNVTPDSVKSSKNNTDADRRAKLPPGMWDMINVKAEGCIREVGLKFFDDQEHQTQAYNKPSPCCSFCDPYFCTPITTHVEVNRAAEWNSLTRPWFTLKFQQWRDRKAYERFPSSELRFFPSLIMPDEVLVELANWAAHIHDEQTIQQYIRCAWAGLHKYSPELLDIIRYGRSLPGAQGESGEMFDEWIRCNDIKRRRIPDPLFNTQQANFDERRKSWMIACGYKDPKKRGRALGKTKSSAADNGRKRGRVSSQSGGNAPAASGVVSSTEAGRDPPNDVGGGELSSSFSMPPSERPVSPVERALPKRRKATQPRREPLQEIEPNERPALSPSRSGRDRRLPSRFDGCDI